jgi:hypothetical protein
MDEAAKVTGFKESYLRDLAKKAGITRIGQKAFDRNEFFSYWKFRSAVEDSPKRTGETSRIRQQRINVGWKAFSATSTPEGAGA